MPSMDLTRKSVRVVEFLSGLSKSHVGRRMAGLGFTKKDAQEGHRRLGDVILHTLDLALPAESDPKIVQRLDALENRWLEVADVTLKFNFPEAHAHVFKNLGQADGAVVIVTMGTFIRRIDSLVSEGVPHAREALALLAERGIDDEVLGEIRALLAQLTDVAPPEPKRPVSDEQLAKLEEELWNWYREWSVIARRGIKDRNVLRALGFLKGGADEEDEDEALDGNPGAHGPTEPDGD